MKHMEDILRGTTVSPSRILNAIVCHDMAEEFRSYVCVVLGKPGPTGKTWLVDMLTSRGFRAMEISNDLLFLVEYCDDRNHIAVDHYHKQIVIVLNKPISKGE